MKIATWNINSIRLRAPLIQRLADEAAPDIICLQETKTPDEHFPYQALHDAGYPHIHIHGMKSYNGVAILSKFPFSSTEIHHRAGREDCRHIAVCLSHAAFKKPLEIHCLYIPAGGDIPDPDENDKFAHKLAFVNEMAAWFPAHYGPDDPLMVLGDFNIAPLENDVWSHKQLLDVVSHTPIEVKKLTHMQDAMNWHDAVRAYVPENEKCYTWWSYRNRDWKKSNRGRRLDHIWVSQAIKDHVTGHQILQDARDWDKPSDHVPVMIQTRL